MPKVHRAASARCTVESGCCIRHPRSCDVQPSPGSSLRANASCSGKQVAELLQAGWRSGDVPWKLGDKATGLNGQLRVPKRCWSKGCLSSSMSRQTQHAFMWRFADGRGRALGSRARCLDWDGWYGGSIFGPICGEVDVLIYAKPFGPAPPRRGGLMHATRRPERVVRWWHADAHSMATVLPRGVFDLVIANSVWEHIQQPFVAMRQVYQVLRPGGVLFWHTPHEFPMHGVPHDYFRYTTSGARAVAESAGLEVEWVEADGGEAALLGQMLGISAKFWSATELESGAGVVDDAPRASTQFRHYLSTRMVAHRPGPGARPRPVSAQGRQLRQTPSPRSPQPGCAAASTTRFGAAVANAWRDGGLPLRNASADGKVAEAEPVLSLLRRRFWQRAAVGAVRAPGARGARGARRCLVWHGPSTPLASLLPDAALSAACARVDNVRGGAAALDRLPSPSYDLVASAAAFAHAAQPFDAMGRIAGLLRSGGVLLWHEPFSRAHSLADAPDFFRFTTSGARGIAEAAGLMVSSVAADGGLAAVMSEVIRLPPSSWAEGELERGAGAGTEVGHYLATAMVARKA